MSLDTTRAALARYIEIKWCWTHQAQSTHPLAVCCQYTAQCTHSPNDQCAITRASVDEVVEPKDL